MKIIDKIEVDNERFFVRKYVLDNNVQVNSLIEIVKLLEGEDNKMSGCRCHTFDEDGYVLNRFYSSVDEMFKIDDLPSPYIDFWMVFCDKETMEYKFEMTASTNLKYLTQVVDKEKISKQERGHVK